MTADQNQASAKSFKEGWKPYLELLSYLRPYRVRFAFGVLMGVLYALLNGSIPLLVKYVGDAVFPGGATHDIWKEFM
ncbi:MAG: hypothetical protein ACKOD5_05065 [Chthoniobacterales bacterium]